MSKRGGFPGMGGFGGMNINQLMKEAKKMQSEMAGKLQPCPVDDCRNDNRCCHKLLHAQKRRGGSRNVVRAREATAIYSFEIGGQR